MSRTVNHTHDDPDGWPFDMPPNTAVLTTRRVVEGHPILEVFHDPDGEWQFLCGSTVTREDGRVACIACVVSRDPALAQLADIPIGWFASRASPEEPWARTRYEGPWERE
ncbi:MAG: hypothetical protein ACRDUB_01375 [Mycobacterium sp.]